MTTGFREYRDGIPHLVFQRSYRAPIADVWDSIVDPERMRRWFGTWTGDPASGKVLVEMTAEQDSPTASYLIDICQPPQRLRLHSDGDDPANVWTLDLGLSEVDGLTTLTFAQVVNDPAMVTDVGPGWQYYLDRLDLARAGGDAERISWGEEYLRYGSHYAKAFELEQT